MTARDAVELATPLVDALIWPVVLISVLLLFRSPITDLVNRIREFSLETPGGFTASATIQSAAAVTGATLAKEIGSTVTPELLARVDTELSRMRAALPVAASVADRFDLLWVDDQPINNVRERSALESLGARITLSLDTDDALSQLGITRFQVVITDMGRPPDDQAGYTLLNKARALPAAPPVVVYAGSATPDQVAKAKAKGAFGCTNRPGELVQLVVNAVARNR